MLILFDHGAPKGVAQALRTHTVDQVVEEYPAVRRDQIVAVLDFLARSADPVFSGEPGPAIEVHAHPSR